VGNLPLVLGTALVREAGFHIAADDRAAQDLAISYISLGILVASLVRAGPALRECRPAAGAAPGWAGRSRSGRRLGG
jgi:hypothetical protein